VYGVASTAAGQLIGYKWDGGTTWSQIVSASGVSPGDTGRRWMGLTSTNTMVVAFADYTGASSYYGEAVLFMQSGGSWLPYIGGSISGSGVYAYNVSLYLDKTNDAVYVAYIDGNTNKITVKTFAGTWNTVGSAGFSPVVQYQYTPGYLGFNGYNDSGTLHLYAGYSDDTTATGQAQVKHFNGLIWANFAANSYASAGDSRDYDISIDENRTVYFGLSDQGASTAPRVQQADNYSTGWGAQSPDPVIVTSAYDSYVHAVSSSNVWLAFRDTSQSSKISVYHSNGSAWSVHGQGLYTTAGDNPNITEYNGVPVAAFIENTGYTVQAMKYE